MTNKKTSKDAAEATQDPAANPSEENAAQNPEAFNVEGAVAAESAGNADLLEKFYAGEFPEGYTIRFETRGGESVAVIEEV